MVSLLLEGDECDVWKVLKGGVNVNEIISAEEMHSSTQLWQDTRDVVGQLLEAGADINFKDKDDMTALCAACKGGN